MARSSTTFTVDRQRQNLFVIAIKWFLEDQKKGKVMGPPSLYLIPTQKVFGIYTYTADVENNIALFSGHFRQWRHRNKEYVKGLAGMSRPQKWEIPACEICNAFTAKTPGEMWEHVQRCK